MFPVTRIKVSKSSNTWGVSSATLLLSTSVPLLSCVLFPIYLTSPTHVALSSSSKPFGILLDDCVFFHATLIFYLSLQIVNAGNLLPSVNVLFNEVLQRERASSQSSTGSRPQSAWSGFVGVRGLIYPSVSLIDLHRSGSLDQIGIIWGIQIPECLAPLYRLYKLDPARDRRFISNTFLVYSHAEIPFSLKGWILCPRASSSKAGKALLLKFNVLSNISLCTGNGAEVHRPQRVPTGISCSDTPAGDSKSYGWPVCSNTVSQQWPATRTWGKFLFLLC